MTGGAMAGCGPSRMSADCMDVSPEWGDKTVPARSAAGYAARRRAAVPRRAPAWCGSARAQERQHREDAAIVVVVVRESELREDRGHVLAHRALGDLQAPGDGLVRAPFRHEPEHRALAAAEHAQALVFAVA